MKARTLIATGATGSAIVAICCFTPILVIVLGAFGLSAWLSGTDYVLFPALFGFLALLGLGLYRRRMSAQACCDPSPYEEVIKP